MDLTGKVVLITGGTGSFGQAFTRLLLKEEKVAAIRIFSRDEYKQSEMQQRLVDERLRFLLGDVRDRDRLHRALDGVDVVVHAAALKQVPAAEYNPLEAVKTNILGAANIIDAAIERGVQHLVALSTDKAANPVNLYGATKLCAEKLVIQGNSYSGHHPTRFSCVRYGNVVASRGSVVPLLYQQRERKSITLTDPRMTRFWITLGEAVRFVRRCVEDMRGGELFVPKMPSVRITDLMTAIAPEASVETVGIRPGEKLHEVLVTVDESRHTLDRGDHYLVEPEHPWWRTDPAVTSDLPHREFVYSSDLNDRWLTVEQIAAALPRAMEEAQDDLGYARPVSD